MSTNETDVEPPLYGQGLSYEEMPVGRRFRTLARTVTDADITAFVGVTGMTEVLFTDHTFAKGAAAKGRAAPAVLSYALMEGIQCQTLIQATGLALLELQKQVLKPTFAGDTIYSESTILDTREASRGDRGVVYLETRAMNQRGEKVLTLRRRVLIPKRDHETMGVGKVPGRPESQSNAATS